MTTLDTLHDLAPAADAGNATRTVGAPLRRALATGRDRTAVVCGEHTETYAELADRVARLGSVLTGLGLRPGDRVGVLGANCHRYLELYLGLPSHGLVIVPLNVRHTAAERTYALRDAGARVLFADRQLDGLDPDLRVVDTTTEYETLLDGAEPVAPLRAPAEHDLAGIFYTGGTTGAAKGVMLSHGNLVANAFHFMACWPFTPDTRWLVVAPMFHAAGTIGALATIWAGGTQVMCPAFTPEGVLDLVERHGVTATLVVPTMMDALAAEQSARPRTVATLRWLSHGSSPAAVELLRRTHAAFPDAEMLHIYGLTETSPIVTLLPGEQHLLDAPQARSCGRAAVGVEVVVVDPADRTPLPAGLVGEVLIRGANVTAGYWNKPDETAAVLRDGWFASGDLGLLDEGGHLFLVDRAKDMIVSGGENVYSAEVENALFAHPSVVEVAVFGVPHERYGEAVHAVVVLRSLPDDPDAFAAELVAHCRATIAGYKVPRSIETRVEPLPKSGAGKILKRELRAVFWAERESQLT
ncbi:long-chain fatty acid--CoA ligase [Actinomycetospora chlora]|uniref:Long-chain fatty acid--CoA ligase n=1 Tax=Actinomycetospora chlora TaxID=663608 RepID=A0ABP9BE84_9PSEU